MEVCAECVFWALLGIQWIIHVWDSFLISRQLSLHRRTIHRPSQLSDLLSEEQFTKARAYSIDRLQFRIFRNTIDLIISSALLVSGGLPWLWYTADSMAPSATTALFLAAYSLFSLITDFPLSFYEHFVVEEKHGFNKYTIKFYVLDTLKKSLVSYVLITPILLGAVWVVENTGPYFFVFLWLFASVVILAMLTIYPSFIAPLFDTYIPLPEGELKQAIEALAASVDYPLKKLYVVDGSKRSAHSNAYMYGFWKNKRIVLYDTLLGGEERVQVKRALAEAAKTTVDESERAEEEKKILEDGKGMKREEVVAVLGHELGHWAESHTLCQLLISELNIFFFFYCFSLFQGWPLLGQGFGFSQPTPTLISLLLVMQYVMSAYSEVFSVLSAMLTRRMEFAADAYAARLGKSRLLQAALTKLSADNLSLPLDDPLYSLCKFSHPPVPERIAALKKFE